jgi:ABC-type Fe3+-hydroxamate transport system substrate-binding protein
VRRGAGEGAPGRGARQPAWQDLDFVRRKRVYLVPEALVGRPSPRLVEGYRALAGIVAALGR